MDVKLFLGWNGDGRVFLEGRVNVKLCFCRWKGEGKVVSFRRRGESSVSETILICL